MKDNSGNGFPIVKLVGYDKPAVLQVSIINITFPHQIVFNLILVIPNNGNRFRIRKYKRLRRLILFGVKSTN